MFTTDRRLILQDLLETLCPNVYFQPPEAQKMVYPCLVYKPDLGSTKFANNVPYTFEQKYQLKLIDRGPNPTIFAKVAALPKTLHDRFFVADNLNHYVFSIYF